MNELVEKFRIYSFKKFFSYAAAEFKNRIIMQIFRGSYSQRGEDLIIDKLLGYKKNGFYIDVGANDPHRFSNTKRFYKKGWRGINIEPDFNNYQKFTKERKDDLNLNIGIGQIEAKLKFYRFIPDTLSTFSQKEADSYIKQGYRLKDVVEVQVKKLGDVLSQYCPNKEIDFISIDTEGFDREVLRSNDWRKFSPALICIESVAHNIKGGSKRKKRDNYKSFLTNIGYERVYDNGLNSIYQYHGK